MKYHFLMPGEYKKYVRWLFLAVLSFTFLSAVKTLFVGLDRDETYAVSLAYRMIQGDRLFKELWEPHQTSALFSALFIKLYIMIFSTTSGIVVALRLVCLVIHGLVSLVLYRIMSTHVHKDLCILGALFYFNLSPKIVSVPEFSIMQVWSVTLLILFLIKWTDTGYVTKWIIAAALAQCAAVLSYPTCVLIFPVALFLILRAKKGKQAVIFSAICFLLGLCFMGYLFSYLKPEELLFSIKQIVSSDATHGSGKTALDTTLLPDLIKSLLFLIFYTASSVLILKIIAVKRKKTLHSWKDIKSLPLFWEGVFIFLCIAAVVMMICTALPVKSNIVSHNSYYFCVLILAGLAIYRKEMQTGYLAPMLVCITAFVATLVLSNLPVFFSVNYMMCAIPILVTGLCHSLRLHPRCSPSKSVLPLLLLILSASFAHIYTLNSSDIVKTTLLDVGGIITEGPAAGTFGDYMTAYIQKSNYQEFLQYIRPGDNLLIACDNTLDYLNIPGVNISTHSTISTPTFDQHLKSYWSANPGKYPTVVAVDCWYGETKFSENTWLGKWLAEEFKADEIIDGNFLRYYIKRN